MDNVRRLRAGLIRWVDSLLERMDTTRAFGWVVGLFIFVLGLYGIFAYSLPGDSNVYIYLAGRMLDGEKYFTDFFEYNTPFAVGIYSLPIAIGRVLGIPDTVSAKGFVAVMILLSTLLTHSIISRSGEWQKPVRYNALLISIFAGFSFCFFEWTTKSTLFMCFILPYIVSLQLRLERVRLPLTLEVTVGVVQGLSVWLKPHYVLFHAVMEIYIAYRLRSVASLFRKSNLLAAAIVLVGYLAILPLLFPGYIEGLEYFFLYYSADMGGKYAWLDNILTTALYCFPLLMWHLATRRITLRLVSLDLFLMAVVAQAVVLYSELLLSDDQKSLLAFFAGLAILYPLLVLLRAPVEVRRQLNLRECFFAGVACVLASIAIFRVTVFMYNFVPHTLGRDTVANEMLGYVEKYASGEPIYTISESVEHFLPALFLLPKQPYPVFHSTRVLIDMTDRKIEFYNSRTPEQWKKARDYYYDSVTHYFTITPPKLVFVSQKHAFTELGAHCLPVTLAIMLEDSPEFAKIWRRYQKIGDIITPKDLRWLEERKAYAPTLTYGKETRQAVFGVERPAGSWVEVYLLKK